jgi:hypothetical protein
VMRTLIRTASKAGRKAAAASRWRNWARDLAGRHGRRPAQLGGPERVLARPPLAGVSRLVRERWVLASRTLQPQIHLAILPVLRPRSGPGLRSVLAAAPPRETLFAPVRTVLGRAPEPSDEVRGTSSRVSRIVAAPLQLVFQRLREPGEVPMVSGTRTGALPDLPETARRLVRKARREELPLPGQPTRVLAAAQAPAERPGGERSAAPWDSGPAPRTASWPGAVPAFPVPSTPVDVGALTDQVMRQIDHRLHAWRERTGSF